MKEDPQLKISIIPKEKRGSFSSFLMFMAEKVKYVLGLIAWAKLLELKFPIDQLFFVVNVKNNKLTAIYWAYIQAFYHAKYKICYKKGEKSKKTVLS